MDYDSSISIDDYVEYFKKQFEKRKDYIFHYKTEVNIWNSFENGKVAGLTDTIIEQWVERWVDSKEMSEIDWYNNHYGRFYNWYYYPFTSYLVKKLKEDARLNAFDTWFINNYLPGEVYPYTYSDD